MPTPKKSPEFIAGVHKALGKGRETDAVSLLVEGLSHAVVKKNSDLTTWLSSEFGLAGANKLIKALAHYPCFYCKHGLIKCGACVGRGPVTGDWPCEVCLASGAARCDFCDGSGWVTYNFVPVGLRLPVIISRVQTAVAELRALMKKPGPLTINGRPEAVAKAVTSHLLALNRLAGIFENALDATRAFRNASGKRKDLVAKIRQSCIMSWKKLSPRMIACVRALHRATAKQAAAAGKSQKKTLERKTDLYERIASSKRLAKTGTGIDHPFLVRAAK